MSEDSLEQPSELKPVESVAAGDCGEFMDWAKQFTLPAPLLSPDTCQDTIADLQGQLALANERAKVWETQATNMQAVNAERCTEIDALQQRVAQLEAMLAEEHPGLDEVCDKLGIYILHSLTTLAPRMHMKLQ